MDEIIIDAAHSYDVTRGALVARTPQLMPRPFPPTATPPKTAPIDLPTPEAISDAKVILDAAIAATAFDASTPASQIAYRLAVDVIARSGGVSADFVARLKASAVSDRYEPHP